MSMHDKVVALESALRKLPQFEPPTNHYHAHGLYGREMALPAGYTIVGKIHAREHFFLLTKGRLLVTGDEGVVELVAPAVMVGKPGTKRAGFALEDCVCMNVHHTFLRDLDEIEAEQIEPDVAALFDARNKLIEVQA